MKTFIEVDENESFEMEVFHVQLKNGGCNDFGCSNPRDRVSDRVIKYEKGHILVFFNGKLQAAYDLSEVAYARFMKAYHYPYLNKIVYDKPSDYDRIKSKR